MAAVARRGLTAVARVAAVVFVLVVVVVGGGNGGARTDLARGSSSSSTTTSSLGGNCKQQPSAKRKPCLLSEVARVVVRDVHSVAERRGRRRRRIVFTPNAATTTTATAATTTTTILLPIEHGGEVVHHRAKEHVEASVAGVDRSRALQEERGAAERARRAVPRLGLKLCPLYARRHRGRGRVGRGAKESSRAVCASRSPSLLLCGQSRCDEAALSLGRGACREYRIGMRKEVVVRRRESTGKKARAKRTLDALA